MLTRGITVGSPPHKGRRLKAGEGGVASESGGAAARRGRENCTEHMARGRHQQTTPLFLYEKLN